MNLTPTSATVVADSMAKGPVHGAFLLHERNAAGGNKAQLTRYGYKNGKERRNEGAGPRRRREGEGRRARRPDALAERLLVSSWRFFSLAQLLQNAKGKAERQEVGLPSKDNAVKLGLGRG